MGTKAPKTRKFGKNRGFSAVFTPHLSEDVCGNWYNPSNNRQNELVKQRSRECV